MLSVILRDSFEKPQKTSVDYLRHDDKPQQTLKCFIEFVPSLLFSTSHHPVLVKEVFRQGCLKGKEISQSALTVEKGGN